MLGIIGKEIQNKMAVIIMAAHKSIVRSHLEYCVQLWSTHLKKDIAELEKIQKWASKKIKGMEHLPCAATLKCPWLFSLEM